ncbi:MAG: hypothetical protein ACRDGR_05600 [bacterium]
MHDDRRPSFRSLRWGIVLFAGGVATWCSIEEPQVVPEAWRVTSGPDGPTTHMTAEVRPGGPRQSDLLRLEWPPHPNATAYFVRFEEHDGRSAAPIPVRGTVFLYDLDVNALRLPRSFAWEVGAVLRDGSEVVTPAKRVTVGRAP